MCTELGVIRLKILCHVQQPFGAVCTTYVGDQQPTKTSALFQINTRVCTEGGVLRVYTEAVGTVASIHPFNSLTLHNPTCTRERYTMRYGRAKQARKTLQFFQRSLGLTAPYHIILDGTFIVHMLNQKVPLRERLDRTLQHGKFTLYVTRSALKELEKLEESAPEKNKGMFQQARQWGLDETDQILENVPQGDDIDNDELGEPAKDILKHVVDHPGYIVASQDETLLHILRNKGSAPVLRLSRGVLLLENPSKASQQHASVVEKKKWTVAGSVNNAEKALVNHVRAEQRRPQQSDNSQQQRMSKKAKGPNPLSCKSKKRPAGDDKMEKKRKRRRKGNDGEE
jgi:U3 small nucleolar RNA-associated protein 23